MPRDFREGIPKMVPKGRDSKVPFGSEGPYRMITLIPNRRGERGKFGSDLHKLQGLGDGEGPLGVFYDYRDLRVTGKTRVTEGPSTILLSQ